MLLSGITRPNVVILVDESNSMEKWKAVMQPLVEKTIRRYLLAHPDALCSLYKFRDVVCPLYVQVPADKVDPTMALQYRPDRFTALWDVLEDVCVTYVPHGVDRARVPLHIAIISDGSDSVSRLKTAGEGTVAKRLDAQAYPLSGDIEFVRIGTEILLDPFLQDCIRKETVYLNPAIRCNMDVVPQGIMPANGSVRVELQVVRVDEPDDIVIAAETSCGQSSSGRDTHGANLEKNTEDAFVQIESCTISCTLSDTDGSRGHDGSRDHDGSHDAPDLVSVSVTSSVDDATNAVRASYATSNLSAHAPADISQADTSHTCLHSSLKIPLDPLLDTSSGTSAPPISTNITQSESWGAYVARLIGWN